MISKSDWTAVHEKLLAEQRERLGPPPTDDELLAYSRGELSGDEEERIRALLVSYPDLARTLIDQPEPVAPRAGDPDYLSQEELAKDWNALQQRIHGTTPQTGGRVLQFWRMSAAIAAALTLLFGGLLWRARSELASPQAVEEYLLMPDGRRGSTDEPEEVMVNGDAVVLAVPAFNQPDYSRFRVEISQRGASSRRRLWISPALTRNDSDTFPLFVRRHFLRPGDYDIVLYGLNESGQEKLATFSVRVPRERAAAPGAPPRSGSR